MASREAILQVIDDLISFLANLAALTPVKFDEAVVNVLAAIRSSEALMNWLLDRVAGSAGIPDGVFTVESLPPSVAQEFRNRGIEISTLSKFLELVMPILVSMLSKWLSAP